MKTNSHLARLVAAVTWLLISVSANAAEFVIGLSPFCSTARQSEVKHALLTFALERAPAGARITVWDAWHLTSVASMEVPALKADNLKARLARMPQVGALTRWFNALTNLAGPTELRDTGALKAPEWLQLISGQPAAGPRAILLLGSPIYLNLMEPTFSMDEGRYPSDGHLACKLTESVFGLAEKKGRLAGTSVHWSYFAEQVWGNDLHRTALTRFWGLFIAGQGGTLATFQADLGTALANSFKPNLGPCGEFQIDPEDTKPLMRTAKPRQIADWLQDIRLDNPPAAPPTAPAQKNAQSPTNSAPATPVEAPLSPPVIEPEPVAVIDSLPQAPPAKVPASIVETVPPNPPPEPVTVSEPPGQAPTTEAAKLPPPAPPAPVESAVLVHQPPPISTPVAVVPTAAPAPVTNPLPIQPTTGKTGAGILWEAEGVDLDIYLKAHPHAAELYYRRTITREGRYYFDYRNRNSNLDYEYCELRNPVDLTQIEIWVNYYKGNVPNPSGKVCLHYGGQTYVGTFTIAANRGNHGRDTHRRANSPYWTRINVVQLVQRSSP